MFHERVLNQCYSDNRAKFGGLKEDYFAPLYLARRFKLKEEDACRWCTFGGFDYGIDAYFLDAASRNLFLFQFKWSDSVVQMAQSIDRLIDGGISAIFGNLPVERSRNDLVNRLRADVLERNTEIDRVFLYFISKGDMPARGKNAALDTRLEDLERETHTIREFFKGRDIEVVVRVNEDANPPPQFRFKAKWTGTVAHTLVSGEALHVGTLSLVDLALMYQKMNLRLLQKNIRAGLTSDTAPNRALRKSFNDVMSGKSNPDEFIFRHNGVSIEVNHMDVVGDALDMVEPRVLNGAQTIVSMHRVLFPLKGTPPSPDEFAQLSRIRVLAKVLWNCSENFVTEVTIANNKQNPVRPSNLRASDRYQIDLEQRFSEEPIRLHYDRLQNSYAARGAEDWEEDNIKVGRVIEIEKLGLSLAAAHGEVDKMSRMPDVWEQETQYKELFQPRYVDEAFDLRRIVLAYKTQFVLKTLVEEIANRSPKKYGFISKGRNLVWALAIQALFNDPKLTEILEEYGTDLKASADFKQVLTKLTTGKLVPILSQALNQPAFKAQVDDEKFSFLRTNVFFRTCMNAAAEKYDWTRKKL